MVTAAAAAAATNTAFSDYNSCSFIVEFIVQRFYFLYAHEGCTKKKKFSTKKRAAPCTLGIQLTITSKKKYSIQMGNGNKRDR